MDSTVQVAVTEYEVVENSNIIHAKLSGGHVYKGPMEMDGTGYYQWNDDTTYDGDFQNSEMTGFGIYKFKNCTYSGHVYRGIRHGHGTVIIHDRNTKYIGEFSHGKRHGKGILYYHSGDDIDCSVYNGDWIKGKRNGNGICVYRNGDEYRGHWYNDCKNGHGIIRWKSFNEIYCGEWENNKPHGNGIHIICNDRINVDTITTQQLQGLHNFTVFNGLNWYYGEWKDGKRDGFGIYNYSDGSQYKGQWLRNKKNGKAEYIYENGTKFVGEFEDDQQKYDSNQYKESIENLLCQHFVINVDDLKQSDEPFDVHLLNKIILRHWKSIQSIFPSLCCLSKLWILMEMMNLKASQSLYDINKYIATCSIYPNKTCNITDPKHRFFFREFNEILLKLSIYSKHSLEPFLLNVIQLTPNIANISLNEFFWAELPNPYKDLWRNQDAKLLFEQRYESLINEICVNDKIKDNVTATYVDGAALNKILQQMINDAVMQSIILKQFENCYYLKTTEALIVQPYEVDVQLDSMKFLVEECRLFFVILVGIKVAYEEMLIGTEREEIEEQESMEEHNEPPEPKELQLVIILPSHVDAVYDEIYGQD